MPPKSRTNKLQKSNVQAYRDRAKALYENDDCSFNINPKVSESPEGAFVEAWVWVPKHEIEGL